MAVQRVSISDDGLQALFVSSDSRLSVFSTNEAKTPISFGELAHLQTIYTAGAWIPLNTSADNGNGHQFIVLGTSNGELVVWDVSKGEIVCRLTGEVVSSESEKHVHVPHMKIFAGCTISDLKVARPSNKKIAFSVFAVSETSGDVMRVNFDKKGLPILEKKTVVLSTSVKRGLHRVTVTSDSTTLFAAGTSNITVLDAGSGTKAATFSGHSMPITGVALSDDDAILVSCSSERNIHLWDIHALGSGFDDASSIPPSAVLVHPGVPKANSLSVVKGKKGIYYIACVGEDGLGSIWSYTRSKSSSKKQTSAKPIAATTSVRVNLEKWAQSAKNEKGKIALHAEAPTILQLQLHQPSNQLASTPGPVIVAACSPLAHPSFFVTPITQSDNSTLLSDVIFDIVPTNATVDRTTTIKQKESGVGVAEDPSLVLEGGNESLVQAKSHVASRDTIADETMPVSSSKREREEDLDSDDEGETLGQRLQGVLSALRNQKATNLLAPVEETLLGEDPISNTPTGNVSQLLASTGSLTTVLTQALVSDDESLLESVLQHGKDKGLVDTTVSRLPVAQVLPFLVKITNRMAAKPARGIDLLPWVKALLINHTGYLLTVPALVPALEGLYTMLDVRLATHKKLVRLSGRLDLLMAQIHSAPSVGASQRTIKKAKLAVSAEELERNAFLENLPIGGQDDDSDLDTDSDDDSEMDSDAESDVSNSEDDESGDESDSSGGSESDEADKE